MARIRIGQTPYDFSGDDPEWEDPLAPPVVSTGPTADEWADGGYESPPRVAESPVADTEDWTLAPPTIADVFREKAAKLARQRAEAAARPPEPPASPAWAEGIDPTSLASPWASRRTGLTGQIEYEGSLRSHGALAGLTLAGRPEEQGLRSIAKELGIRRFSRMRKEPLIQAITAEGWQRETGDLPGKVAGMSAADITAMRGGLTPAGSAFVGQIMPQRSEIYTLSQSLFGFSAQNVDVAMSRAGIPWSAVEAMSKEQVLGIVHRTIADEFIARGGAKEWVGPEGEEEPYYYAPRAVQDMMARGEGETASTSARLVPGAAGAALGQAWALQRGVTPSAGAMPDLGGRRVYRGTRLITDITGPLQAAGVAAEFDEEGQPVSWVAADPGKASKRMSQLMQEFGVAFTGLETVQSNVLGQMAEIPETVQVADAWISFGDWMPQGSAQYGKNAGKLSRTMTRRVRLPKGEELTIKAGQAFRAGEQIRLFGSHAGYDWSKDFEEVVVQHAETVTKHTRTGEEYQEIQFQAIGTSHPGALTALKHGMKGGATPSKTATDMGVDVIIAPNELYQLGAAIASVADPKESERIWGVSGQHRWGTKSGKQFAEWMLGSESPLEERLLPAQTFGLADPETQKLIDLGRLINPKTGEAITQKTLKDALIPGTQEAISAQVMDIGFRHRIGVRASQVFAGSTTLLKEGAFGAVAEQYPRMAKLMYHQGVGHQRMMSHLAASIAANVDPGSEVGSAFIKKAIPAEEIGRAWPQFAQKAGDMMREAGYKEPGKAPDAMRSLIMSLIGEAHPGRGLGLEGAEGATRYFPNPLTLSRTFGFQFQEHDVGGRKVSRLNQLPATVAAILEDQSQRTLRGGEYIPADMIPEDKSPADYTEQELSEMSESYRADRIEGAFKELIVGSSTKERVQSLLGVSTHRMVGSHPTAVLGVPLTKFLTSDRILKQMLGAATPGASEEDLAELQDLVTTGKVPGPEMIVAGYPIVDPGQAKIALSYMKPDDAITRGLADTRGELNELFGGRIGVNQSIAYMQEKDWDVDEFLRLVKGQYTKKDGEWSFDPLGKAATESELRTMLRATSISGEEASALEKMTTGSTIEGVRGRFETARDAPTLPIDELQAMSEEKVTGGRIKGMAYNIMLRNVQARMKGPALEGGHAALADARRSMAIPFQTALDLKPIEGGWQNIIERLYSFNLATLGWQRGQLYGKGEPDNYVNEGLLGYANATINDVLDLKGMKGEAIQARHLAASLVSPAVDEERWQDLTGLIGRYQTGERGGLLGNIREAVYGGLKAGPKALAEERSGALKELHERSPLLSVGLEAAAFKAVAKGDVVPGEKVWRKTASGAYKSTEFGEEKTWLAEKGELMRRSIQALSPLSHLSDAKRAEEWNLWARLEAVEAQATRHPHALPARAALATRAMGLARGPREPEAGSWEDFLARQGTGVEDAPVEMMAPQGSGMGVLEQMLSGPATGPTGLRSVITETIRSVIGVDPASEGSAAKVYEFAKKSQRVRAGERSEGGEWERHPEMSPLRRELNKLLGGMAQEARPEALGLWQEEVGKYGLTMTTGRGGMYHQYQRFAGRYEKFAAAEKFPNAADNEPADIPAFIQESEAGLLRHLEKERIPPDAVTSAIASKPSTSDRFAAVQAEFQSMGDEEQAAYRARYSRLDPNADTFGRRDKRYTLRSSEGLHGPSFQNPSVEDMLRQEREQAADARRVEQAEGTGTRITQEGLTLMQQTLQGLMGGGGVRFYGQSTEAGDISGTFKPLGEPRPPLTQMQHFMATQFMQQVPGMEEAEFLRGVSGLGLTGVAPGLERLRGGKFPTAAQMGQIEELLGVPGADIALELGQERPARATGRGAGAGAISPLGASAADIARWQQGQEYDVADYQEALGETATALKNLSEGLGLAREDLDKYGDTMQQQITAYEEGRLKIAPDEERKWKADVRTMATQARAITEMAKILPGDVPQGLAGDVGRWGGLLQQAQGAGLATEMGAGFAGAQAQTGLRGFLGGLVRPEGRGPLGKQGPMRGIESVYSQLTDYWKMFRMQRLWGATGGAAMAQIPMAAQEEQAASRAAMATMPMGQFTTGGMTRDLMAFGAQRQAWQAGVGRAAYGAWGWAQQGSLGEGAATAAGILGPAVGGGMLAGTAASALVPGLAATAIGIPVAGVLAGIGATKYAGEAMGDRERMAIEYAQQEPVPTRFGGEARPMSLAGLRAGMEQAPEWMQTLMLGKDQTFFGMEVGAQQRPETELGEYGRQLLTGPLSQLEPAGRAAAIQEAATRAIKEGGPLYGFAQPAVSEALGQWYAATPGAEEQAPGEILEDPRFVAMMGRGMRQEDFGRVAGQWGMAPGRWQEVQAQMGGVTQAQAQQTEFVAGQWAGLRQLGAGGADIREAAYGGQIGELGTRGQFELGRLTGGSRMAWTAFGQEQGVSEFQTVDPETGMGIGTNWGGDILGRRIRAGETSIPGGPAGDKLMDITINAQGRTTVNIGGDEVDLTQWALQAKGREMGREEQLWQQGMARTRFEQQREYQVQQFGFQDTERQMQYGRQMQQFGFAQEGLDMNYEQFMERQGMQSQQFEWQTQYQREGMGIQFGRQMQRMDWAEEDLAFKGAQTSMQFGWQMEDIGEQLRYSTGRERRQLMKQRERATIQFGMGMGQLGEQGERLDERREWAEEDHQRGKAFFEQRIQWTRREMEMSHRHFTDRHSLSQRRLNADKSYFQESFAFQDTRIEAEREYWNEQQVNALAMLIRTEDQTEAYTALQIAMVGVQEATALQVSEFAAIFDSGGVFERAGIALAGMFDYIERRSNSVGGSYDGVVQTNPYDTDTDPYGGPGHVQ